MRRGRDESRMDGILIAGDRSLLDSLPARRRAKVGGVMEKALRAWLDAHQLPAIIAAVVGVIATLSVLLVLAGYLIAKP
jgi:hypothetical protein